MAIKQRNEVVKKSNALIRAHWTIESVWEPRLIAILASKVHVNDEDFKLYEISASSILGKKRHGGHDYKELEAVIKGMIGRVIEINEGPDIVNLYSIFSRCSINRKTGIISMRFDSDLKKHYLQLKERFTQYSLAEFMSLPSTYSQRLYEILKSWSDKPTVDIELNELSDMLDVPKSFRKDFGAFRRKVLEQAHRDIVEREYSSLWFDWEPIKQGRGGKVTAVRFVFNEVRAKELTKNQPPPDELFVHQKLQHDSNRCFEQLAKRGKECTPRLNTEKCVFCTKRGRMATRWRQKMLFVENEHATATDDKP
jgi:plasmid replication initiation protein